MGIQERKQREKDHLKTMILDTATEMFINEGYDNVSIRKIAGRIEYSPATLYLYYKNKDELLYQIQIRAFEKFNEKLNEFSFIKDPLGRLRSIATSYYTFAIENPGLYKLMFLFDDPLNSLDDKSEWIPGQEFYQFLKKIMSACIEANLIKRMNPDEVTFMFWSFLHGLSSLSTSQRLNFFATKETLHDQNRVVIDKMMETLKPSYF